MISVVPLRLYVADYDRAFRLHDEIEFDYDDRREGQELWADGWTMVDDAHLDRLREDEREAATRDGAYAFMDPELAAAFSRDLEHERSELYSKLILHVCPERKVKRCRRSFCDSCCAGDGGRPSGFAVQAGNPNRRSVMPVKSRGGKRLRKRPAVSGSGVRREDEHG